MIKKLFIYNMFKIIKGCRMIFNKIMRIIWGVSFFISLLAIFVFNYDSIFRIGFGVVSAVLFIADFIMVSGISRKLTIVSFLQRKWHLFAILTQWLFWVMLLYIPFRNELSLGYKLFFITDLFIMTTYAFYKFSNQRMS